MIAEHKCQHVAYRMTCDEYDSLLARSGGACEVCREVRPRMAIDHEHRSGWSAVRGLLCPKCNAALRYVDSGEREPTEAIAAYLANPWHLRRVDA